MRFDLPADARVEGRAHRTRRTVQARFQLFELPRCDAHRGDHANGRRFSKGEKDETTVVGCTVTRRRVVAAGILACRRGRLPAARIRAPRSADSDETVGAHRGNPPDWMPLYVSQMAGPGRFGVHRQSERLAECNSAIQQITKLRYGVLPSRIQEALFSDCDERRPHRLHRPGPSPAMAFAARNCCPEIAPEEPIAVAAVAAVAVAAAAPGVIRPGAVTRLWATAANGTVCASAAEARDWPDGIVEGAQARAAAGKRATAGLEPEARAASKRVDPAEDIADFSDRWTGTLFDSDPAPMMASAGPAMCTAVGSDSR